MIPSKTPSRYDVLQTIGHCGVVPVVTIDDATVAPQLGAALLAGNLPIAEITLRTDAALDAIRALATHCPDVAVGAGTVLTVEQAAVAIDAGATFIVTPGFDEAVVDYCLYRSLPIIPGVMTPTDINFAIKKGLCLLKFFPAEAAGGCRAIKAIGAPYRDLQFIPTGGVSIDNLSDYLSLPHVFAVGGSWMVPRTLLRSRCFDDIAQLAAQAVSVVKACRA